MNYLSTKVYNFTKLVKILQSGKDAIMFLSEYDYEITLIKTAIYKNIYTAAKG